MRETLAMNKLYKNLLFIAMVVGPIYWLMFTEDGKRRTDTMVLWLAGGESIEINFSALDPHFQESDWKQVYPELEWQCKDTQSPFGNFVCFAEIASYNGIPAQYLSVFFHDQLTRTVKLGYRDQYHIEMAQDLQRQIGKPAEATDGQVLQWGTRFGKVLMKKKLDRGEDPVILWLARSQ